MYQEVITYLSSSAGIHLLCNMSFEFLLLKVGRDIYVRACDVKK